MVGLFVMLRPCLSLLLCICIFSLVGLVLHFPQSSRRSNFSPCTEYIRACFPITVWKLENSNLSEYHELSAFIQCYDF